MSIMDKVVKAGNYKQDRYGEDDFELWAVEVLRWPDVAFARYSNGEYVDNSVTMARLVWDHAYACGFDEGHFFASIDPLREYAKKLDATGNFTTPT